MKMNSQQVISIVLKISPVVLAFLVGKGYITQEEANAGGAAVGQILEAIGGLATSILVIVGIVRSIRTHKSK